VLLHVNHILVWTWCSIQGIFMLCVVCVMTMTIVNQHKNARHTSFYVTICLDIKHVIGLILQVGWFVICQIFGEMMHYTR
jgi:hypothetical protein